MKLEQEGTENGVGKERKGYGPRNTRKGAKTETKVTANGRKRRNSALTLALSPRRGNPYVGSLMLQ